MNILDDKVTSRLASDVQSVREVARNSIEQTVARQGARLRSGTKTRKSAATREKIMSAAAELMVEHGSTDFQMSEVSERCAMSKGALYYYFADKTALVRSVFDRSVDGLVDSVEGVVAKAPSSVESIFGLVQTLVEGLRPGTPLMLAMTRGSEADGHDVLPSVETHLARIISILTAQFERAKEEGLVRAESNSRLSAVGIVGAFVVYEYVGPDIEAHESSDLVREMLDLVFSGMGTARARTLFSAKNPTTHELLPSGKDE